MTPLEIATIATAAGLWGLLIAAMYDRIRPRIGGKKYHFKKMVKQLEPVIWEKELAHFKQLGVKEQYRTQYDHVVDSLQKQKAQEKQGLKVDPKATKDLEKSLEILKQQLDDKDAQIKEIALELQATIDLREITKGFIKYNT